jgi:hypothetical protein
MMRTSTLLIATCVVIVCLVLATEAAPAAGPTAIRKEPSTSKAKPSAGNKAGADPKKASTRVQTPAPTPAKPAAGPSTRAKDLQVIGNAPKYLGNTRVANVLECWGSVIAGAMLADTVTTKANLNVEGTLTASRVRSNLIQADHMIIDSLSGTNGVLTINGDVAIVNEPLENVPANPAVPANATGSTPAGKKAPAATKPAGGVIGATAFIAEDIVLGGVKQWRLVRHEHFDQGAEGWSLLQTSSCAGRDSFLGGHCHIGAGEVSKTFDKLPPHSQVRVTGRYHFIDNWQGETAFLKLGEKYAWSEHTSKNPDSLGIHMCGSEQYPERKMSTPIDVTMPHSDSFLQVAFGSTGDAKQDPCERSFGVDDVMVYVR